MKIEHTKAPISYDETFKKINACFKDTSGKILTEIFNREKFDAERIFNDMMSGKEETVVEISLKSDQENDDRKGFELFMEYIEDIETTYKNFEIDFTCIDGDYEENIICDIPNKCYLTKSIHS